MNSKELLGTEHIINHTFQCERYFSFENLKKYHKCDSVGHCPIYIYIYIYIYGVKAAKRDLAITIFQEGASKLTPAI